LAVSTTRNATGAPRVRVTGASNPPTTTIDVLTARFTPSGALSSVVQNGSAPCVTECAA
jgi:hypothetical protein